MELAAIQASIESASADHRNQVATMELLRTHVALYGYEVASQVPHDGNCFFHAVAFLLNRTDAKELRKELTAFVKTKVSLTFHGQGYYFNNILNTWTGLGLLLITIKEGL